MPLPSDGDTSSQHSMPYMEAPNLSDINDLTGVALSNASSGQRDRGLKDTSRNTHQQPFASPPKKPLPSVDNAQQIPLIEKQNATSSLPQNPLPGVFALRPDSMLLSETASDNTRQLGDAQQRAKMPTSAVGPASPILEGRDSRADSPSGLLKRDCERIRRKQEGVNAHTDGPPRQPQPADFPPSNSAAVLSATTEPVEYCVLLLHQSAATEKTLELLARNLRATLPESAFVSIRAPQAPADGNSGYHWGDPDRQWGAGFIRASSIILEDIIRDSLMAKCNFRSQNIVILGYGQGGMVALAAAASWNNIEFGGVISIGGPIPTYALLPPTIRSKTPALILSGAIGEIGAVELQQIKNTFVYTDLCEVSTTLDVMMASSDNLARLFGFLAHRLRQDEWNEQAVVSFDGGGIRGYGSLLILRDLMNKIGDYEKSLDATESSFAPCDYRPTTRNCVAPNTGSTDSLPPSYFDVPDVEAIVATPSHELPNSSLFLPCHYFNYAAGTSTGGLISIMLSRLRMSVNDCIEEYEALGEKIFGHPRPIPNGAVLWHKFDYRILEQVIKDVTARYSERGRFPKHYAFKETDQDMFQCMVLAYADIDAGENPYLFRTYPSPLPSSDPGRSRARRRTQTLRNPGDTHDLPIWQVARATSAAPGYFPPIRIEEGNSSDMITFKDGGFGSNNPSEEAYYDVSEKHGGTANMGPFISIGTGKTSLNMFGEGKKSGKRTNLKNAIANLKTAMKLPSRTAKAHETMMRLSNHDGVERFPYYRFDGGKRLGEVGLGEWKGHKFAAITGRDKTPGCKTIEKIKDATAAYLESKDVQKDLMECAKILVERRRLRTRNASSWDRYASFSYYDCEYKGCPTRHVNTAQDFRDHIRRFHYKEVPEAVIEKVIPERRRVHWIYRPKTVQPKAATEGKSKNRARDLPIPAP